MIECNNCGCVYVQHEYNCVHCEDGCYCTIDASEHERIKDIASQQAVELHQVDVEVERLKKELEQEKKHRIEDQEGYDNGWKEGVVEGERRTMQRVKEAVRKAHFEDGDGYKIARFEKELGLGDDKPFNPETDHHNCSAGTCAACGHFDEEQQ